MNPKSARRAKYREWHHSKDKNKVQSSDCRSLVSITNESEFVLSKPKGKEEHKRKKGSHIYTYG